MSERARKNLERCKMDCFNCPFPDCVLPYDATDTPRKHIEWTPEIDKAIVEGKESGKSYAKLAEELEISMTSIRKRYLELRGD